MGSWIFSWPFIWSRIFICVAWYLAQISRKAITRALAINGSAIVNGTYFSFSFSPVITLKTYVLKLTHSVCLVAERPHTGIWLTASWGTGTLRDNIPREEASPPTPAGGPHSRESIAPGYGIPPLMLSRTDILLSLESGWDHLSTMQLLQDTDQGKIMQCWRLFTACLQTAVHRRFTRILFIRERKSERFALASSSLAILSASSTIE